MNLISHGKINKRGLPKEKILKNEKTFRDLGSGF